MPDGKRRVYWSRRRKNQGEMDYARREESPSPLGRAYAKARRDMCLPLRALGGREGEVSVRICDRRK